MLKIPDDLRGGAGTSLDDVGCRSPLFIVGAGRGGTASVSVSESESELPELDESLPPILLRRCCGGINVEQNCKFEELCN